MHRVICEGTSRHLTVILYILSHNHMTSQDVRVPVCPLCDQPVPVKKGEDPNIRVNEHITSDCVEQKKKKVHFAELF